MTTLPSSQSSELWRRWRERAVFGAWASMVLFGFCVVLVVVEQVASDFYYLDQRNPADVVAAFVGDVAWLFTVLASTLLGGVMSLIALLWIVAYISVRCEEHRDRKGQVVDDTA